MGGLRGVRSGSQATEAAGAAGGCCTTWSGSVVDLRHTCLTRLVRAGNDIVLVAELAGHARLETTRRYSLPSDAARQAAMDALTADY